MCMFLRFITCLLITSMCHAQTTGSPTPPGPPGDIAAITAQADQGDTEAQIKLGDAYLRGLGVTRNDAEAVRWFSLAANKGNAKAQFILAPIRYRYRSSPRRR